MNRKIRYQWAAVLMTGLLIMTPGRRLTGALLHVSAYGEEMTESVSESPAVDEVLIGIDPAETTGPDKTAEQETVTEKETAPCVTPDEAVSSEDKEITEEKETSEEKEMSEEAETSDPENGHAVSSAEPEDLTEGAAAAEETMMPSPEETAGDETLTESEEKDQVHEDEERTKGQEKGETQEESGEKTGQPATDTETVNQETTEAETTDPDPVAALLKRTDLVIFDQSEHAVVSFRYEGKLSEGTTVSAGAVPEEGMEVSKVLIFRLEHGFQSLFEHEWGEKTDARQVEVRDFLAEEDGSAAFSFQMPAQDVVVIALCKSKTESGGMLRAAGAHDGEAEWGDKGEYLMVPDRYVAKESLAGSTSEGWKLDGHGYTRYRTCRIRYTTEDGTVTDWMTVTAYCLQASLADVASLGETTFDESNTYEMTRRALLLMSDQVFASTSLGTYFRDHGVTDDANVFAMQHMIATYSYWLEKGSPSGWTWNAVVQKVTGGGPGVGGTGAKLNAEGEAFVKGAYELIKGYGPVDCRFVSAGAAGKSISIGKGQVTVSGATGKTPSITYDSIPENTLTLSLGNLTLVNETTGARMTSSASIPGGTVFHLEAPLSGNPTKAVSGTCKLFTEGESAISASVNQKNQDLGFAGTTSQSVLRLSVEWPDPLYRITVSKKDALTNSAAPSPGYQLAGAVYGIYEDAACGTLKERLTIGAGSSAVSGQNYRAGTTWYVREITPPAGYETDQTVYPVSVTGGDVSVTSFDMPMRVAVSIRKTDAVTGGASGPSNQYSFAGARYCLYLDSACTKQAEIISIGADGTGKSAKLYPVGTYYVRESTPPSCGLYETDNTVYPVSVDLNRVISREAVTVVSKEQPKYGAVRIRKTDLETGSSRPQTDSLPFEGALFAVYADEACEKELVRLTTDREGTAATERTLPAADYWIKELKAPEGYVCSSTVWKVSAQEMTRAVAAGDGTVTVEAPQQVIRGNLSLMKVVRDKAGKQEEKLPEGIIFRLTYTADPSVTFTVRSEPVTLDDGTVTADNVIVTDESGYASTADAAFPDGTLLYGEWLVEEHGMKEGYNPAEPVRIHISSPGQTIRLVLDNNKIARYVKIIKEDANTGSRIPAAGVSFQIEDEEGNTVSLYDFAKMAYTDTWTTDENGEVLLQEALDYGTYTLKETGGIPEGYTVMEPLPFSVGPGLSDAANALVLTAKEPVQTGRISILKKDESTGAGIAQTVFDIITRQDVTDASGEIRTGEDALGNEVLLREGVTVDEITTDGDGKALSKELFPGEYLIREKVSAQHYAAGKKDLQVSICPDPAKTASDDPVIVAVEVENRATTVQIMKKDARSGRGIPGVTFRIREKEPSDGLTDDEQKEDQSNTGPEGMTVTTDETGAAVFSGILCHRTTYLVTEEQNAPGYLPSDRVLECHVDENGLIDGEDTLTAEWENQPTRVTISKQSMTGTGELPGARLMLQGEDGTLIEEWVSGDTPHEIDALPPGRYTLTEITAPKGYEQAETITFEVKLTGEIQPVVMVDAPLPETGQETMPEEDPVLETESEAVTEAETGKTKKPEPAKPKQKPKGPEGAVRTGDETGIAEYVMLACVSLFTLLGLFGIWFMKRTDRSS